MPHAQVPQPAPVPTLPLIPPEGSIEQAMMELKEGTKSPQVEKLAALYVKSKLKESKDGSAVLKTGGKVSQQKIFYNVGKKKSFTYVGIRYSMLHQNSVSMSALKLVAVRKPKSLVTRSVIVMCGPEQGTSNGLVSQ